MGCVRGTSVALQMPDGYFSVGKLPKWRRKRGHQIHINRERETQTDDGGIGGDVMKAGEPADIQRMEVQCRKRKDVPGFTANSGVSLISS